MKPRICRRAAPVATALWGLAMSVTLPAAAQLHSGCFVSALNRTAPVQEDGTWVLPNVPASQGQVRIRATCIENGILESGQSELFTLSADGVLEIPEIVFGDPEPIPVVLELSAPVTRLESAGQTVQVSVTAFYPDDSTLDVTSSASGTGYRSSNPGIASVDAEGTVTAHASGVVLISALNEGALGVLELTAVVSADSDGDGLPDDYEAANGLDPGDPLDALDDPDHDGLTTLREFQTGLMPFNPDTDGDGLRDGDELNLYHTNPLLLDTDGDEVSDGLEVQSGSDPLDPASINLAAILTGLTAQPATLNLIFNTALGEESRRLEVRGRLVDGRTIDLRRRSRGTNYSSSNLAVAGFGAEDGRIFAGQDGTATVTVTNNGFSAVVQVNVASFSPTALAFLPIPGYANGVDASGSYAYVAAGSAGLYVVDVAVPESPRIAGFVDTPGNANDVRVADGFAYVADGPAGLTVVDVRSPAQPSVAGRRDTPGTATDVAISGDRAYVAAGEAGLQILDVADPSSPALLGGVDTPGNARGVDANGALAVVADSDSGLQVIDVADPANPVLVGSTSTRPEFQSHAADVVLRGRLAYVADGADFNLGGLRIVDLQEPSNPVVVGSSTDEFALAGLALEGRLAFGADYFFVNGVPIFDVSGSPVHTTTLDFSAEPSFRDDNGNGIAVNGGLVFLAATSDIQDNGVTGSGGLHIGRYRVDEDNLGVAPRVAITSPAAGSTAPERARILVQVEASDDFSVAFVQFLLNGVPVAVDTKLPFEARVEVPAGVASFTLGALAVDYGGNRGEAEPVEVSIGPDTAPRVTLLSPVAGNHFTEGVTIEVAARATDDVNVEKVEFFVDGEPWDVRFGPPYRTSVVVPVGEEQFTVQAVATDSAGLTVGDQVTVGIDDDAPPFVAVVAPAPGAELVSGSRTVVLLGAADDRGVGFVRLSVNGGPPIDDFSVPYEFPVRIPAGTELVLTAVAEDIIGQQTTVESRFPLIPDPGTTAEGRVLDTAGLGVPGATVHCLGQSGTSGADGTFSITGVPTVGGPVSCGATVLRSGDLLEGRSAAVTPAPGETTDVGDIVVAAQLLYLGSGLNFDPFLPGRLLVFDSEGDRLVPWSAGIPPAGLSGLAFDGAGRLFATAAAPQAFPTLAPAKRRRLKASFGSGSRLLRLDPDTGAVLETIGPVVDESGGGGDDLAARGKALQGREIGVQDLTFDSLRGRFYALSEASGKVYTVDPTTGVATTLVSSIEFSTAGLAVGPDGLLYLLAANGSDLLLTVIDPEDGSILSSDPVTAPGGGGGGDELTSSSFTVGGMTLRPGSGTFLLTTAGGGPDLFGLDPVSLQIIPIATPTGEVEGGLQALALRPLGAQGTVVTTLVGQAVDADGAPVAGAVVSSLGAFGTTGGDGRFELANVTVRTGTVRVAIEAGEDLAFSAAVPPVPNGVTDLGVITLGASVCVTGRLVESFCVGGPITVPLDLYLEDEPGHRVLVGEVVPDPTGRFCADLRPRRRYFARKEDFECICGPTSACEAQLTVSDPGAAGACGDPSATCQDLGDVNMSCDFFCGGS